MNDFYDDVDDEEIIPVDLDHFFSGMSGLPDSYDDPRIDTVCRVLSNMYQTIKQNPDFTVSLEELFVIVDNAAGEFYSDDYWTKY
jgi:hypothetical protein